MMFGQLSVNIVLLLMLYAAGATTAALACIYLLLRRSNAFAPEVSTPRRLRRWTALFFAFLALGHLWYLPALFTTGENAILSMLIGALLDCLTLFPLAIIILLCMLQDRQRPLWPVAVMITPMVILVIACIYLRSYALKPVFQGYLLLLALGLSIYMVRALRQYRRWLRDNYADLENKEVWQSFVVFSAIMLVFGIYSSGVESVTYEYITQICGILLTCFLLWRVETLSDLSITQTLTADETEDTLSTENTTPNESSTATPDAIDNIGTLLQQHCVDTQLYLQHDLTVVQLAQVIGTNRVYLSQYFSRQDTTYNAYINTLRINHFISLYREAIDTHRIFTVQQLATESGYRSYSTFSLAFKQRTGQSVTAWMRE